MLTRLRFAWHFIKSGGLSQWSVAKFAELKRVLRIMLQNGCKFLQLSKYRYGTESNDVVSDLNFLSNCLISYCIETSLDEQ